ncbi:putative reverse transcriptase domain, reverse transcriptase zinc-binding domain protein [Tanacetum coccineum]
MVKSRVSRSRIDVITNTEGDIFENDTVALEMVREVSDKEVKDAMFSMGDDKSPGPDGFTAAFFKEAWSIIGNDVIAAVREFFRNGTILKELNHTIITLIPKVKSPSRVNDYRPISCCNVLFKCISKIIANRIKHCLKSIVSPNQSAFVPGRSITDNILLTQELMHNYHLDRGPPRCAFKVDIQKAYDTVDWNFLRMILHGFGFHETMVSWIMECVSSTSYSICINGSLHGFFKGKRGLRQGDPLSPYLFTLVMEVLTLMLQRRVQASDCFTYHRLSSSHVLPFEEGRLPVKYLGVPLVSSRLMVRDCNELVDKVQLCVQDWKNKALSIAGRLQLIQSVLGIFFGAMALEKGKSKVAWEIVCLPKEEGGLGIRRLECFNLALMATHVWKLLILKESLWVKWIHEYKLKGRSFWDYPLRGNMSWGWRKILSLRPIIRRFIWSKVGNGNTTSIWYDQWSTLEPLAHRVSSRDIVRSGLTLQSKVSDIVVNGTWSWPVDMLSKYPFLSNYNTPINMMWIGLFGVTLMSRTTRCVIAKLVVAASAYYVWQERNWRLFQKGKRSIDQVVECIKSVVRLKLLSCKLKKSKSGESMAKLWDLPEAVFV